MFTGIIQGLGTLKSITSYNEGRIISIETDVDLKETLIGDSIAVNGVCLTVIELKGSIFKIDMAPETVERTVFKKAVAGTIVNIEKALRLSDRLNGHIVSGHIDGTGIITAIKKRSNAVIFTFKVPSVIGQDIVEKGSVAVDGISLTVNICSENFFEVSIIPHTAEITTMGIRKIGDNVNIETDVIGKYIKQFLKNGILNKKDISKELLYKQGFI